jgi:hypothetical protein
MKNTLICKNCSTENPFYGLICTNCKAFLRERIFNIDLWKILGLLIESPATAFRLIIQSEHKNFLSFLILLISGKFFITSMFIALLSLKERAELGSFISNYLIILIVLMLLLAICSYLITILFRKFKLETRFKDNFSIIIYSFIPYIFGFIILFPVELILFGGYLFSVNPSPFVVKESLAYTLLAFEILIILWGCFLSFIALYTQSRNIFFSLTASLIINLLVYSALYLCSVTLFS